VTEGQVPGERGIKPRSNAVVKMKRQEVRMDG
jgi:hypothetical protein